MADQSNEMGIVERLARALAKTALAKQLSSVENGAFLLEIAVNDLWPDRVEAARAAIEAMREPSEAMVAAADMAIDNNIQKLDVAKIAYIAAIDAALSHDEVKG